MRRSHLLLLVKGLGKNSGSQIPGKLYEYLASGNPIVHIGPDESEAAEIIAAEGSGRTFNENVEELADFLYKNYLTAMESRETLINLRPNRDRFSSRNMARRMHEVFESLGN
jgi:glycosyltransferase involved in cell wall biosynthesis